MNAPKARLSRFAILLLSLAIPASCAFAQNDIEDPSVYPGSWYRIVFGTDGQYVRGDGDGYNNGTWYYYPQTGWYRQWFYNEPYRADRKGSLRYEVYIKAVDPTKTTYVEVNFNWAKPEWSELRLNRPPLPDDIRAGEDESEYMTGRVLYVVDDWFIGTIEPIKTFVIEDYNPDWVSIDIRGRNACVYRGVLRECIGEEGACCNPDTGGCYMSQEKDCTAPYRWLGPGVTCGQCQAGISWLDFGDAPDTYGTSFARDGARHTVVAGVYLGSRVDPEVDGSPGLAATGDDLQGDDEDGVVFTAPLVPGGSTTIEVTASIQGYLNAWIDYNQDGSFNGQDEQVFTDELLTRGVNRLTIRVPESAVPGDTYARFRFNTRGLLLFNGPAADGEVEDYKVALVQDLEPQANTGKGGIKWGQTPQAFDATTPFIFNGWDELSNLHMRLLAADDWECRDGNPVTGLQWWGSFQGWKQSRLPTELPLAFHVAVWTHGIDNKAADPAHAGHPDTLVWEAFCTSWTWNVAGYGSDPRGLNDDTCFQFTCLLSQDQWFYPTLAPAAGGTPGTTMYWLSIAAMYDTRAPAPSQPWGWTTRPQSLGCGAVQIHEVQAVDALSAAWPPGPGSRWLAGTPVEQPAGVAWDLAFELLTNQASSAVDRSDLAPVYRFWSDKLGGHFYTISEAEKNQIIKDYPKVWTFEGIAFYAWPPDKAPVGSKPVYRFWSDTLGHHFYTISEGEKQKLLNQQPKVWTFECVAWYAFD
jgi:hypothetical protein